MLDSYRFVIVHDPSYVYSNVAMEFAHEVGGKMVEGKEEVRVYELSPTIDNIRMVKQEAEIDSGVQVWVFTHVEKISQIAGEGLLKLTEEVPKHMYIILVTSNLGAVPKTLISRAKLIEVPTPVLDREVEPFVVKVYDNIHDVTVENSFKIANGLDFTSSPIGLTPSEFLYQFNCYCTYKILQTDSMGVKLIIVMMQLTNKAIQELQPPNANKKAVIDTWVARVREWGVKVEKWGDSEWEQLLVDLFAYLLDN